MWYVIQTIIGKEIEIAHMIDKVIGKKSCKECLSYKECFVIQQERVWRIERRCQVHIEPLFPSYVFVETRLRRMIFSSH